MMESHEIDATGRRILDAAMEVFSLEGFTGATTDQIAAAATASKQSIYRRFGDKKSLFAALMDDFLTRVRSEIVEVDVSGCGTAQDAVQLLARQFAESILDHRVQQFRRLVVAEATRFPDLGMAYYRGAFEATLEGIARVLDGLVVRGLLRIDDTAQAANHLAGLMLWVPSNQIMMTGRLDSVDSDDIDRAVTSGVKVFLSAYAAHSE